MKKNGIRMSTLLICSILAVSMPPIPGGATVAYSILFQQMLSVPVIYY